MSASQNPEEEFVRELCSMEAPLGERLDKFSAFVREFGVEFAEAYDELAARLSSVKAGSEAPNVGEIMPEFVLPDSRMKFRSLSEFLEKGPLVVSFNRGHWCPYCMVELHAYRQAHKEIAAAGAQVVSIMPDQPEYVAKVASQVNEAFPILSDEDNGYALSLNLAIWLGDQIRKLNCGVEIALEKSQGNDGYFVPIPATFVVGPDGTIAARFIDPDFRRRMEIDDVLAALRQFRT
jgi:peroxiredoxin